MNNKSVNVVCTISPDFFLTVGMDRSSWICLLLFLEFLIGISVKFPGTSISLSKPSFDLHLFVMCSCHLNTKLFLPELDIKTPSKVIGGQSFYLRVYVTCVDLSAALKLERYIHLMII